MTGAAREQTGLDALDDRSGKNHVEARMPQIGFESAAAKLVVVSRQNLEVRSLCQQTKTIGDLGWGLAAL